MSVKQLNEDVGVVEAHARKSPVKFLVCVFAISGILCGGAYWLVDHLYSAESKAKDATIQQKDARIATVTDERDKVTRENERLSRQLTAYQTAQVDKSLTLKKRTLILTKQIKDYAATLKPNDYVFDQLNYWESRFYGRVNNTYKELDVAGIHSPEIDNLLGQNGWPKQAQWYNDLADEFVKLANQLPDTEQ